MKIRLNKNDLFDNLILWCIVLQIVIIRWLDLHEPFSILLAALIAIRILIKPSAFINKYTFLPCVLFAGYSVFNYLLLGGEIYIFLKNVWRIAKALIIALYFLCLLKSRTDLIAKFFRNNFKFFNIYMLINIPIIITQLSGHYILLGLRQGYDPNATIDFVSGLFGVFGMPRLNLYILFLFFFNLYYIKGQKKSHKNTVFKTINYIFMLFWLIAGTTTDNKALYILIILYIGIYFCFSKYSKIKNKIEAHFWFWNKMVLAGIGLALVSLLIVYSYAPIREMIDSIIFNIVHGAIYMNRTGGSNERIGMIFYAWTNPDYRWLGAGLAKYETDLSWGFGFAHFGQADFGVYMVVGGTFFIITLIYFFWKLNTMIYGKGMLSIIMVIASMILLVYTQFLTDAALLDGFLLFQAICYFTVRSINIFQSENYRGYSLDKSHLITNKIYKIV